MTSRRISILFLAALCCASSHRVLEGAAQMEMMDMQPVTMTSTTEISEEGATADLSGLGIVRDFLEESTNLTESFSGFLKGVHGDDPHVDSGFLKNGGRHICEAGRTFSIKTEGDVFKAAENGDLECLFATGIAPLRPPVGIYYGKVLEVFHSGKWNNRIEAFWGGKLAMKSQCRRNDSEFYMALNFLANDFKFPALLYVGTLRDRINEDDYDDGKDSLFIDYTVNMEKVCPLDSTEAHNFNLGIVNPRFPMNKITDLARYVGKLKDGGHILLGKTFVRDILKFPNKGDRTVAFWYVVNYDDEAYPSLPETLGPIAETFGYRHADVEDFISENVLNLEDFLDSPLSNVLHLSDMILAVPKGLPPKDHRTKKIADDNVLSGIPSDKAVKDRYFNDDPTNVNVRYEKSGRVRF